MKSSEIREIPLSELQERIQEERVQLHRLEMTHAVTPLENPMQIRARRRTIARMLTIYSERMRTENNDKK
jgi:ribosomal protein L29